MTHETTRDGGPDGDAFDLDGGSDPPDPDDQGGPADPPGDDDHSSDRPGVPDPNEVLDRRTLVKLLIALAFGIPILIEARTFLGLVASRLFGEDDDDATGTTTTTEPTGVGQGDELLAATPQTETVESLSVDPGEDAWTFSMTVTVENDAVEGEDYQFRVSSVTGTEGTTVTDPFATDRLEPGASERLTGSWDLPAGERPTSVRVAGISIPEDGSPTTTEEEVELSRVSVRR